MASVFGCAKGTRAFFPTGCAKATAEGDRYGVARFGPIEKKIRENGSLRCEIEEPGCNTVKLYDASRMSDVKPVWVSELHRTNWVETGKRYRISKGPTVEILSKQYATQGHQRPEVTVKNLVYERGGDAQCH